MSDAPKKKKSPTARSLQECKRLGWAAQVVERYCIYSKRRIDLFSCIDIVAITLYPRVLGIQATGGGHNAVRREKIVAEPRMKLWLETGALLQIWNWEKQGARGKRKTWKLRVVDVTLADFDKRGLNT